MQTECNAVLSAEPPPTPTVTKEIRDPSSTTEHTSRITAAEGVPAPKITDHEQFLLRQLTAWGRASKCYKFWTSICQDRQVLRHVGGITIPFTENNIVQDKLPHEIRFSNRERQFVLETLQDLISTGCVQELDSQMENGWVSNIFLRPKRNGSFRMILNLKPLNKLIAYQKFKMPNIHTVMSMIKRGDKLVSIDLSNAYSSLKIRDDQCRYLQFKFEGRFYRYLVLPNGIAIGHRVFVETTKAITRYLRKRGVNMIIYIDDTLLIHTSPTILRAHRDLAIETFRRCGFVVNYDKSLLEPSTQAEFLGFEFDTVRFTITLTKQKTQSAIKLVTQLLRKPVDCKIRFVAKVIGTLVSIFPACDDGPLHYRTLEHDKITALKSNGNWNGRMNISTASQADLK